MPEPQPLPTDSPADPAENVAEDSYYEGPYLVFTAAHHRKRGYCCGNVCRHCPYDEHGEVVAGKGER